VSRLLREENELLREKNRLLEAEGELMRAEIKRLRDMVEGFRKRIFGASSEKLDPAQIEFAFKEGDLLMGKPVAPQDGAGAESPEEEKSKSPRKRTKKADLFPKNLKVLIDGEVIPDEVRANPDLYEKIGEDHHDELEITRSELFWRRIVISKYRLKEDRSEPPVQAPAPAPSIPGTLCGPSLAAAILIDKFEDHLPHYRQSQRYRRRCGVELSRQTINRWHHATARHLQPIAQAILKEIRKAKELQIDETPVDYLEPGHGSVRKGHMWVYHDPHTGAVYYDWDAGRGHERMFEVLGQDPETGALLYRGNIQCDGYSAYEALKKRVVDLEIGFCLSHMRRKFIESGGIDNPVCKEVLAGIARIYQIDQRHTSHLVGVASCRGLIRRAYLLPVTSALKQRMTELRRGLRPTENTAKALDYTLSRWDQWTQRVMSGEMELDNNLVENRIRPLKLGAKNWLFNGNLEAGYNNALIYTLLGNCRAHGLNAEDYLEEVIKRLPPEATEEKAAALTPAAIAASRKSDASEDAA